MSRPNFRKSDFSSLSSIRVFNIFDLPNILSVSAEPGNMAFSDNSIYYRSNEGWVPLAGISNIQAGGNITVTQNGGNVVISDNGSGGGGGGVLGPNISADNLRFPFTTPDLLMRRSGPQNLLLTSNTGSPAVFEVDSLRTNALVSVGNLSLNPSGSSIDFNGKNIINAANIPTETTVTYTLTNANWTGSATLTLVKSGRYVTYRISGVGDLTCNANSAFATNGVITDTTFRPQRIIYQTHAIIASVLPPVQCYLQINSSGDVRIEHPTNTVWQAGNVLQTNVTNLTGGYLVN